LVRSPRVIVTRGLLAFWCPGAVPRRLFRPPGLREDESRSAGSQGGTMDLKLLSRGDGMVLTGFAVMLLGTSLNWYLAVSQYVQGTLEFGVSGWSYTLGWLSWLCALAAVLVVLDGALAKPPVDFGDKAAAVVCGLGAIALLLVVIGLFSKPSFEEIAIRLVTSLDSSMLNKVNRAADWTNEIDSSALGLGIFASLVGAGLVTLGGFMKTVDPVRIVAAGPALAGVAAPADAPAPVRAPAPTAALVPEEPLVETAPPAVAAIAAAGSAVRFCSLCGKEYASPGDAFCSSCGARRPGESDEGDVQ